MTSSPKGSLLSPSACKAPKAEASLHSSSPLSPFLAPLWIYIYICIYIYIYIWDDIWTGTCRNSMQLSEVSPWGFHMGSPMRTPHGVNEAVDIAKRKHPIVGCPIKYISRNVLDKL